MSRKHIVISVDTYERTVDALALGRLLAEATTAPVALVSVVPHSPLGPEDPEVVAMLEESAVALSRMAADAGLADARTEVVAGDSVARELQEVSERPDSGILVTGSTRRGPVGRLLIGGVGERLLSGSACPVAIAPHGYAEKPPQRIASIGVGLDGSTEAQHALEAGIALAGAAGATLRVITAFHRLAFGGVAVDPGVSVNEMLRSEVVAVHEAALSAARRVVPAEGRFVDGGEVDVLLAEGADLDLLVIGSRGYGPPRAVLMGTTSYGLAHGAQCPLLVTPRGTRFDLLG